MSTAAIAIFDIPQNRRLIGELSGAGRDVLVIPPPDREDLLAFADGGLAAEFLRRFDWIVLADWIAADAFVAALRECRFDLYDLDLIGICAVGESVCDRLRLDQIHSDVVPRSAVPSAVAAAFDDYAGTEPGLRVLVVGGGDSEVLRDEFGKSGREAESVTAYRLAFDRSVSRIRALLEGGAVDELIVSHPSDVAALKALAPSSVFAGHSDILFRSDDPATRLALLENGVPASRVRNVGQ